MGNSEYVDLIALIRDIPDLYAQSAVENMGGSEALYEQVLKKVTSLLPVNIAMMDEAMAEDDLNAFGLKAHGMKGSFNQVGCLRLAELAEALEDAAKGGDAMYCRVHYGGFKKAAFAFCERIEPILRGRGMDAAGAGHATEGCIADFADALEQARAAAAGFDSTTAAKYLMPLMQYCFGREIDLLISQAMEELELFHPRKAVPYITVLLKEYTDQKHKKGGQADGQ